MELGRRPDFELDYVVVRTPDAVRHAQVRDTPVLLCGRAAPAGSSVEASASEFDCAECHREAELRGDRSVGVVDA